MNASIFWPLTRNDGQFVYVGADLGVRPTAREPPLLFRGHLHSAVISHRREESPVGAKEPVFPGEERSAVFPFSYSSCPSESSFPG